MHFFVNMVNIQKIRFAIRSISGFSGSGDSDTSVVIRAIRPLIKGSRLNLLHLATLHMAPNRNWDEAVSQTKVIKSFHSVWKLVSPFETDFAKRKVVEEFLYLVKL